MHTQAHTNSLLYAHISQHTATHTVHTHTIAHTVEPISIVDTTGTQLAVLYREVSLIQRKICTQLYVVGTADSVLIREVYRCSECPL